MKMKATSCKTYFVPVFLLTFAIGRGLFLAPSIAEGKVYKTREVALKEVFSDADAVEKINVFLGKKEQKKIEAIARSKLETRMFTFYAGRKGKTIVGYAVFGSYAVKDKPAVFMVVMNPDGSIKQVEIMAFYEPEDYLPSKKWFKQFAGKILNDELWPKKGIDAEDLAQEVFLRIYLAAANYNPSAKFSTWLYRIAVNISIDHKRKPANKLQAITDSIDKPIVTDENEITKEIADTSKSQPENILEQKRINETVRSALLSLPSNQRIALTLNRV